MIYINFHLGDWLAQTRLLSATERGVYLDLLTQYYANERPLTEEECKRIARAYAPAEQEAMQYVLQTLFTKDNGAYRNARADAAIAEVAAVSDKRKRAAKARWAKGSAEKPEGKPGKNMQMDMHVQSTCNANAMQSNTQYPISNKEERKEIKEKPAASAAPSRSKKFEPEELATGEIDKQLYTDWLTTRGKAPVTATAWGAVVREAGKAGMSLDAVLRLMIERGWRSFRADWRGVKDQAGAEGSSSTMSEKDLAAMTDEDFERISEEEWTKGLIKNANGTYRFA